MRKTPRKGLTLGTVLLAVVMVASLGFALSTVSVQHLGLMNRQSNSEQARNLAESTINLGIERVLTSTDYLYGKDGSEAAPLEVSLEGTHTGSLGRLTFNPDLAEELSIPYSTNNIDGTGAVEGWSGKTVPPESIHLVAVGECGEVTRRLEVVLHVPAFPFALASSGPVNCLGGVTVASLKGEVRFDAEGNLVESEELFPAHILSNSPNASPGVKLGSSTLVTGDVQAAGSLDVAQGAEIRGLLKPNSSPIGFPMFNLSDYDPGAQAVQVNPNSGGAYVSTDGEDFRGPVRVNGDFVVNRGGITLDGSLLYVDGNVNIRSGGVTGTGLLVANGNVLVDGDMEIEAGSDTAILCAGDLTLEGNGTHSSFIRGLFYARGVVRAEQLTVVGTMIAGDSDSDSLTLVDARFFDLPGGSDVSVSIAPLDNNSGGGQTGGDGSGSVTVYGDGTNGLPARIDPFGFQPSMGYSVPATTLAVSVNGQTATITMTFLTTDDPVARPVPATHVITLPSSCIYSSSNPRPTDPRGYPEFRTLTNIFFHRLKMPRVTSANNAGARLQQILNQASENLENNPDPDDNGTDPPGGGGGGQIITIDPSEFLDMLDRIQIVYWQEG
jgi:hypothetical protein